MTKEQIRSLRLRVLHISQEELGRRLDVTRVTVSRWEIGQRIPEEKYLRKMRQWFGLPPGTRKV